MSARALPRWAVAALACWALVACCPAATPAPTAFAAVLERTAPGDAWARSADGRRVALELPTGAQLPAAGSRVYVTGSWTAEGAVAVTAIRAVPPTAR